MCRQKMTGIIITMLFILGLFSISATAADTTIEAFNGTLEKTQEGVYTGWIKGVSDNTVSVTTEADAPLSAGMNYVIVPSSDYAMTDSLLCKPNTQYYISGWVSGSPAAVKVECHTTELADPEKGTYVNDVENAKSYSLNASGWTYFDLSYTTAEDTRDIQVLFRATGSYGVKYANLKIEEKLIPAVTSWTLRSLATAHQTGGVDNEPYVECDLSGASWSEIMNYWPTLKPGGLYTLSFWSNINLDNGNIKPYIRIDAYSTFTGENEVQNRYDYQWEDKVECREFGYKNGTTEAWEKADGDILDNVSGYSTFSSPTAADVGIWKENRFVFAVPDYGENYNKLAIRFYAPYKVEGGKLSISRASLKEYTSSVTITDGGDNPVEGKALLSGQTMKFYYHYTPGKECDSHTEILFAASVYENTPQGKKLVGLKLLEADAVMDYTSAAKKDYMRFHLLGPQKVELAVPMPELSDGSEYTVSITAWNRTGGVLNPSGDKYTYTANYNKIK